MRHASGGSCMLYGIISLIIVVAVIACIGIVFMVLGSQAQEMQSGTDKTSQKKPKGTKSAHHHPRNGQSTDNTKKTVSDLYGNKEIMDRAKELRRLYGKEVYVKFLNGKAKELGIRKFSLTSDEVL